MIHSRFQDLGHSPDDYELKQSGEDVYDNEAVDNNAHESYSRYGRRRRKTVFWRTSTMGYNEKVFGTEQMT